MINKRTQLISFLFVFILGLAFTNQSIAFAWSEDCTNIDDWEQANDKIISTDQGNKAIDQDVGGWHPSIEFDHLVYAGNKFAPQTPPASDWWVSYGQSGWYDSKYSGIFRELGVLADDWEITISIDFDNYSPGPYSHQGGFYLYLLNEYLEPMLQVYYQDGSGSTGEQMLNVRAYYYETTNPVGDGTMIYNPGAVNARGVLGDWIIRQEDEHTKCFWPSATIGQVPGTGSWVDLSELAGDNILQRGSLKYLLIVQRSRYWAPTTSYITAVTVEDIEIEPPEWQDANGDFAIDGDHGGWHPSIAYSHILYQGYYTPASPPSSDWWISYPTSGYSTDRYSGVFRETQVITSADWELQVGIDFNNYAPGYYSFQGGFEIYLLNEEKEPMLRVLYWDGDGSSGQHKLYVRAYSYNDDGDTELFYNPGVGTAQNVVGSWIIKKSGTQILCYYPSPLQGSVPGTGEWQDLTALSGKANLLDRGIMKYLLVMQRSRYRAPTTAYIVSYDEFSSPGQGIQLPPPTGEAPATYTEVQEAEACEITSGYGASSEYYKTWADDGVRHWLSTTDEVHYEPIDVTYAFLTSEPFKHEEGIDEWVYGRDIFELEVTAKARTVSGTASLEIYDKYEGWTTILTFSSSETLKSKTYRTDLYRYIELNLDSPARIQLRWVLTGANNYLAIDYQQISFLRCDTFDLGLLDCINAYEMGLQFSASELHAPLLVIIDSGLDPDVFQYIQNQLGPAWDQLRIERYIKFWRDSDLIWRQEDQTSYMDLWTDETGHGTFVFSAATQIARTGNFIILDFDDLGQSVDPQSLVGAKMAFEWLLESGFANEQLVVSFSYGWCFEDFPDPLQTEARALLDEWRDVVRELHDANVTICVASGNDPDKLYEPAIWDETISVGAVYENTPKYGYQKGDLCETSSRRFVTVCAPGYAIQVFQRNEEGFQQSSDDVIYELVAGTSVACPVVAAAISVILHHNNIHYESYSLNYGTWLTYNCERFEELFSDTAENTPSGVFPIINQNPAQPRIDYEFQGRGWGILDFWDAFMMVIYPPP